MPDAPATTVALRMSGDVSKGSGSGMPLLPLAARGLVLEIDGKRLIDGIDLDIAQGTITAVMGPNGAGKSLLMRMLHGLIPPSAGTIRWGGEANGDRTRRRQAMVFQRPVLLRRSVAANLDFVLSGRSADIPERRRQLLDLVGLADRSGQAARLLSGGEQQRLALARALALEPEVLFLDEPTASLDPASVAVIEEAILVAHRSGTKVICVTHDIGQARRLAGDVAFLHRGRLIERRSAEAFFSEPESEAARAYLAGRLVL